MHSIFNKQNLSQKDFLQNQVSNNRETYIQKMTLTRMGSFNSRPKIDNQDTQDDDFKLPANLSLTELIQYLQKSRGNKTASLLKRTFKGQPNYPLPLVGLTVNLSPLNFKYNKIAEIQHSQRTKNYIRVFQWNILSQSLGEFKDSFVVCPREALSWDYRKYLILMEILQYQPDVICLQEVDHFKFVQNVLKSVNYEGIFCQKPDSPCMYIKNNNGPDGCAIFYRRDRFTLKRSDSRTLEAWYVLSNQVVLAVKLCLKHTDQEICILTTHLKARRGVINSKLRNEQGNNLLKFMHNFAGAELPIIVAGDFNAEPTEPVYSTILRDEHRKLGSAYADWNLKNTNENQANIDSTELSIQHEPLYTTWKIRESGEECHTIDYIFYSTETLKVANCLEFPNEEQLGKGRTPSLQYPSDHFSLVCDFEILN